MKICVEKEYKFLIEQLKKRGYKVTSDNDSECDAIICNLKNGGLFKLNVNVNIKREGTLIIDLGSKSIEEIEYILKNKAYSNIF